MAKAKTKKSLQKRVRFTACGKIKRAKAGRSHLMRRKSSKRRLKLKKPAYVNKVKKIKEMLPYK